MSRTHLNDLPQDETLDLDALSRVRGGLLPAVKSGITDGTSNTLTFKWSPYAYKIADGSVMPTDQLSLNFVKL